MIIGVKINEEWVLELIQLSENTSIVSIDNYFVLLPKGKYEYIGNNKNYDILQDNNPDFRALAFDKILAEHDYIMENNRITKETELIWDETEKELRRQYEGKPVACFRQIFD